MEDRQAIRDISLDYIEGWYSAYASRMDRALSAHLDKRRIVSATEICHVEKPWIIQATREGRGKIENPLAGRSDITTLDQTETLASVKIV